MLWHWYVVDMSTYITYAKVIFQVSRHGQSEIKDISLEKRTKIKNDNEIALEISFSKRGYLNQAHMYVTNDCDICDSLYIWYNINIG